MDTAPKRGSRQNQRAPLPTHMSDAAAPTPKRLRPSSPPPALKDVPSFDLSSWSDPRLENTLELLSQARLTHAGCVPDPGGVADVSDPHPCCGEPRQAWRPRWRRWWLRLKLAVFRGRVVNAPRFAFGGRGLPELVEDALAVDQNW